jgi:hypothetical protein
MRSDLSPRPISFVITGLNGIECLLIVWLEQVSDHEDHCALVSISELARAAGFAERIECSGVV